MTYELEVEGREAVILTDLCFKRSCVSFFKNNVGIVF